MRTQKEHNVNDKNIETYIGVDVAKATLDAYRIHDKAPALGLKGLPMQSIPQEFRAQFENVNVHRYIDKEQKHCSTFRLPFSETESILTFSLSKALSRLELWWVERILNCSGLFEGKSLHPSPIDMPSRPI